MSNKPTQFKKGEGSANPHGRPKGRMSKPISRLRSTLNKLKQLEPDAVDVIEKSLLNDDDVQKPQVDTAKWIITSIASLTRTAIAEESYKVDLKTKEEEMMKSTGTNDSKPIRFTTHIIAEDDD